MGIRMVKRDKPQVPASISNMARQVLQGMISACLPKIEWAIAAAVQAATRQQQAIIEGLRVRLAAAELPQSGIKGKGLAVMRISKPRPNEKGQVEVEIKLTPAARAALDRRIAKALHSKTMPSKAAMRRMAKNIMDDVRRGMAASKGGKALVRKYGKGYMKRLGRKGNQHRRWGRAAAKHGM